MRHFVGQDTGQQAIERAFDLHVLTEHAATVKSERRSAAGAAHIHGDLNRTPLRPGRHLMPEPFQRLLPAIGLCINPDLLRDLRRRGFDQEIRRRVRRAHGRDDGSHKENDMAAHRHVRCLLSIKWEK